MSTIFHSSGLFFCSESWKIDDGSIRGCRNRWLRYTSLLGNIFPLLRGEVEHRHHGLKYLLFKLIFFYIPKRFVKKGPVLEETLHNSLEYELFTMFHTYTSHSHRYWKEIKKLKNGKKWLENVKCSPANAPLNRPYSAGSSRRHRGGISERFGPRWEHRRFVPKK